MSVKVDQKYHMPLGILVHSCNVSRLKTIQYFDPTSRFR